ncbi:u3 small nucleolar RNA-associated protein 11 [Mycena floridula]|nr:u3 small nucleolar RNA-associated protein 11 [Mycena floridula]
MTSSIRNSVHRRNHKERSQLVHRTRLGILEKHKDYVKRAQDYHSKKDRITRLRQKASERNKDEFYFSMTKEKTKGGVHVKDRGNVALPTDLIKVLKTQDENYVRTMRAAGLKKIDKLKEQLTSLTDLLKSQDLVDDEEKQILKQADILPSGKRKQKSRHLVFVDNAEQATEYSSRASSSRITEDVVMKPPAEELDLGWKVSDEKSKVKKRKSSTALANDDPMPSDTSDAVSHRRSLLKELSARLVRDKELRYAEREFEMQRLLMGKGGRKKIVGAEKVEGGAEPEEDDDEIDARKGKRRALVQKMDMSTYKPRVYKWRLERKR